MSDALSYLIKARPEAMKAYFTFLKDTGKHLDPKTRSLISVITKIDSQTERGLRQYLPRALRDGASPHEILDAILMAFPTLGLAKIIWAIDILLDMDIPEFSLENLGAETAWHDLIDITDVKDGDITYIDECDGRSLFIYRSGDDYRVYDSRCPDVTTGECVDKGTRPLRQFDSRVREGRLEAIW